MPDRIEELENRRLQVLEEQAALYGPQTEPHILIEIAELKHKRRSSVDPDRRAFLNELDYDFLMNVMSSVLVRFNIDKESRKTRQLVHDIWMVVITILVFLTLLLVLTKR